MKAWLDTSAVAVAPSLGAALAEGEMEVRFHVGGAVTLAFGEDGPVAAALALRGGDAVALPWQLLMEQHYLTNTEVGWGKGQNPGLSAGDMAILWLNLADMGYVLVHREDQAECGYCTELVALRVFC
jgi:hypothetical protein